MFATFNCRDGIEDYHLIASTCILIHLINKGVIRLSFRSSYIPTRQRKPRCSTERTSIYSLHITVTFTLSITMDDTSTSIVGRFAEDITRYDRCQRNPGNYPVCIPLLKYNIWKTYLC